MFFDPVHQARLQNLVDLAISKNFGNKQENQNQKRAKSYMRPIMNFKP